MNKELIETSFSFLTTSYGFNYSYCPTDHGNYYCYANDNGVFVYYFYEQFKDEAFYIFRESNVERIILPYKYPREVEKFHHAHKGIKWTFKGIRTNYWKEWYDLVATLQKQEIERTGTLWGLPIDEL